MAKQIFVPTESYQDWKRLLGKPDLHWKEGYSAMTLARAWEAAGGVPPEVLAALECSPRLKGLTLLLAIPEYQVPLPGGDRPSQTDLFVLARGPEGLVTIAVEGKVDEPFGPMISDKERERSPGVQERIAFLLECLHLPPSIPGSIRYQLLHRTASAVILAEQFCAKAAVMLVHSFSLTSRWFDDFHAFGALFGKEVKAGFVIEVATPGGIRLYLGWCKGDQRFRYPPSD